MAAIIVHMFGWGVAAQSRSAAGLDVSVSPGGATWSGSYLATASGLAAAVQSGGATATPGPVSRSSAGLDVAVQAGSATATPFVTVSASGLAVAAPSGAATATPGPVSRSSAGLDAAAQLGSATWSGSYLATAGGLDVAAPAGAAIIAAGPQVMHGDGLDVETELGAASFPIVVEQVAVRNEGLRVAIFSGDARATGQSEGDQSVRADGDPVRIDLSAALPYLAPVQYVNAVGHAALGAIAAAQAGLGNVSRACPGLAVASELGAAGWRTPARVTRRRARR